MAWPGGLHLLEHISRRFKDDALRAETFPQIRQGDFRKLRHIRFALNHGRKFRQGRRIVRIEPERFDPRGIERQLRRIGMFDADHIGKTNFILLFFKHRCDLDGAFRREIFGLLVGFVRQKGERHPEDIDIFGREQPRSGVNFIRRAPQPAPDHLLAQQLT